MIEDFIRHTEQAVINRQQKKADKAEKKQTEAMNILTSVMGTFNGLKLMENELRNVDVPTSAKIEKFKSRLSAYLTHLQPTINFIEQNGVESTNAQIELFLKRNRDFNIYLRRLISNLKFFIDWNHTTEQSKEMILDIITRIERVLLDSAKK